MQVRDQVPVPGEDGQPRGLLPLMSFLMQVREQVPVPGEDVQPRGLLPLMSFLTQVREQVPVPGEDGQPRGLLPLMSFLMQVRDQVPFPGEDGQPCGLLPPPRSPHHSSQYLAALHPSEPGTLGGFNVSNLMGITRRMIDIVKKITFYFLQNV